MKPIYVNNAEYSALPVVPTALKQYIEQITCCDILPEVKEIEEVFFTFADYVEHNPPPAGAFTTIIYTFDGKCSFEMISKIPGVTTKIIFLNMFEIRSEQHTQTYVDSTVWPVLLEELFHSLYNIQDEYEVKAHTVQVLKQHWPEATFDTLYQTIQGPDGVPVYVLSCQ